MKTLRANKFKITIGIIISVTIAYLTIYSIYGIEAFSLKSIKKTDENEKLFTKKIDFIPQVSNISHDTNFDSVAYAKPNDIVMFRFSFMNIGADKIDKLAFNGLPLLNGEVNIKYDNKYANIIHGITKKRKSINKPFVTTDSQNGSEIIFGSLDVGEWGKIEIPIHIPLNYEKNEFKFNISVFTKDNVKIKINNYFPAVVKIDTLPKIIDFKFNQETRGGIEAEVHDYNGINDISNFNLYLDNKKIDLKIKYNDITTSGSYIFYLDFKPLESGVHQLKLYVSDKKGNTSSKIKTVVVNNKKDIQFLKHSLKNNTLDFSWENIGSTKNNNYCNYKLVLKQTKNLNYKGESLIEWNNVQCNKKFTITDKFNFINLNKEIDNFIVIQKVYQDKVIAYDSIKISETITSLKAGINSHISSVNENQRIMIKISSNRDCNYTAKLKNIAQTETILIETINSNFNKIINPFGEKFYFNKTAIPKGEYRVDIDFFDKYNHNTSGSVKIYKTASKTKSPQNAFLKDGDNKYKGIDGRDFIVSFSIPSYEGIDYYEIYIANYTDNINHIKPIATIQGTITNWEGNSSITKDSNGKEFNPGYYRAIIKPIAKDDWNSGYPVYTDSVFIGSDGQNKVSLKRVEVYDKVSLKLIFSDIPTTNYIKNIKIKLIGEDVPNIILKVGNNFAVKENIVYVKLNVKTYSIKRVSIIEDGNEKMFNIENTKI